MSFNFNCDIQNQKKFYGNYVIPEEVSRNVAVDLGSNVGFFEEENVNEFKSIYAIEASYQNFLATVEMVNSIHASNIFCFNLACASKTGEIIKIYRHNNHSVSCVTVKEMLSKQYSSWKEEREKYHNVMSISFEGMYKFLSIDYIDYLKVDIEGAEFEFLLDQDLSKVGCLAAEIHGTLGQKKKDDLKRHIEKFFVPYHIEYDLPAPQHSVITYLNKNLVKI